MNERPTCLLAEMTINTAPRARGQDQQRNLASFSCVGAGLAFTLRGHILVDALSYTGIAICLPIPATDRAIGEGTVAIVNCNTEATMRIPAWR